MFLMASSIRRVLFFVNILHYVCFCGLFHVIIAVVHICRGKKVVPNKICGSTHCGEPLQIREQPNKL